VLPENVNTGSRKPASSKLDLPCANSRNYAKMGSIPGLLREEFSRTRPPGLQEWYSKVSGHNLDP
jgi:hypothetical protein